MGRGHVSGHDASAGRPIVWAQGLPTRVMRIYKPDKYIHIVTHYRMSSGCR
jgi:hypothetical protein